MAEILTGDLTLECSDNIKIVRIFTSSTFTDTKHERDHLMEKVYPKLKDIYSKKGYQFQVVDMRWGIRDESTYQHLTTELCLKELALCQKLSTGPNLVAFISHRYGWTPPPRIISKCHFEMFLEESKNTEDHTILSTWYKKDDNRCDHAYILQPVEDIIKEIHSNDEKKKKSAEDQWWKSESPKLEKTIKTLAKKSLSSEEAHFYFRSVTETEIRESVFKDDSVKDHCLWFKRTIKNIDHSSKAGKRFLDENIESQHLLENLKTEMSNKLGDSNVLSYEIDWTEKGVDPENEQHRSYLEKFCNDFEQRLIELIERDIAKKDIVKKDMSKSDKELYEEVLQHTLFCKEKCKNFVGRVDILKDIQAYVRGRATDPLIVHGESGSGKTSIMAKAAMEISKKNNEEKKNAVIILRFIGTTLHSSDADSIMESIIRQIQHNYGYSESIASDEEKLKKQFHDSLKKGTPKKPLIVILDALDQQNVCNVNWLMNEESLPLNTKLILSTLPEGNCLLQLKSCIKKDSQFLEVDRLNQTDAEKIFDNWLKENNRTVTVEQRQTVLKAFDKCPLPLFLKLSFDIAKNWHSYSQDCEKDLMHTVRDNIINHFKRMERKHGEILISHVLGYITLAKNGISSQELEDVLSCDEEVLDDCLQYWIPPIRRLPPLLLFRILDDFREYLFYRGSDGTQVIYWYHRQFIEAAKERYCSDQKKKCLYSELADYFSGRWADNEKPIEIKKCDRQVAKQPIIFGPILNWCQNIYRYLLRFFLGISNNEKPFKIEKCDRQVAKQPIKFGEKPNLRKLNNLPHLLVEAKKIERLKDEALLNLEFLTTKIKATSIREVINDFHFACERFPEDEAIGNVSHALHLSRIALSHDLDQLPAQLLGRLPDIPELHSLKKSCCKLPHFEPNQSILSKSNTQLLLRLQNAGYRSDSFDISADKTIVVSAWNSLDGRRLKFWSIPDGDQISVYYSGVPSAIYRVQFCNDDQLVAVNQGDRIDFISTENPSFSHSLDKKFEGFFQVCGKKKSWILFHSCDNHLIISNIKTMKEIHQIELSPEKIGVPAESECRIPSSIQAAGSDNYVVLLMKIESLKVLIVNLQTGNVRHWDINQFYSEQMDDRGYPKPSCNRIALCPNKDLLYLLGKKCLLSYNLLEEITEEERVQQIWDFSELLKNSEIGISIDGQFVYSISGKTISLYNSSSKEKVTDIIGYNIQKKTVCMMNASILMARLFNGELCIWDSTRNFESSDTKVYSPVPDGSFSLAVYLPNYRYMLFQMPDKSAVYANSAYFYVYDVSKGEILMGFKLNNCDNYVVHPTSKTKVVVANGSKELRLMDLQTCITKVFRGKSYYPFIIKPIKDGKEILTAYRESPDIKVYNTENGLLVQRIEVIDHGRIRYISISKSGNIAVAFFESYTKNGLYYFCIIDLNRYELKYTLKPEDIPSCSHICWNRGMVQVSPDGTLLLVGREDDNHNRSSVIWNIEQREVQCEMSDHDEYVLSPQYGTMRSFSADFGKLQLEKTVPTKSPYSANFVRGDEFVMSTQKGMIRVFSKNSGELRKEIELEIQEVPDLIFPPNENPAYFLSKQDNFLCLWNFDTFLKICTFETDQPSGVTMLSPNGDVIVCRSSSEGPPITLLKYSQSDPDAFLRMEEINSFKELGFKEIIDLDHLEGSN